MLRGMVWDVLRRATPRRLRRRIKAHRWFIPGALAIFGNEVYSASYYEDVERIERDSVGAAAEWIVANLAPERMVDVGCGPGHLMQALEERGVDVFGVDLSEAALAKVAEKGLTAVRFDLTGARAKLPGAPYDLAISCEVAEHLGPRYAAAFADCLTGAAPVVYLTAAEPTPGQIGLYHLNEQPNRYWIDLMARRGYHLDPAATDAARAFLAARGVIEYLAKPMIFRRAVS